MSQYFLKGWISAYPGEGSMRFNLPDGVTNATWTLALQNSDDASHISLEAGYVETQYENDLNYAWVSWNNTTTDDIFFDYEITPLYASSST